jgi:hypothetical protein
MWSSGKSFIAFMQGPRNLADDVVQTGRFALLQNTASI